MIEYKCLEVLIVVTIIKSRYLQKQVATLLVPLLGYKRSWFPVFFSSIMNNYFYIYFCIFFIKLFMLHTLNDVSESTMIFYMIRILFLGSKRIFYFKNLVLFIWWELKRKWDYNTGSFIRKNGLRGVQVLFYSSKKTN